MRRGGGKVKGGDYEKRIARKIGEWWCGDQLAFYKSYSSGGRATVVGDIDIHPGDVVPIKKEAISFPICIECKKVERDSGWKFESVPNPDEKDILVEYWNQLLSECGRNIPWLVFSRNREIDFLGMSPAFRKGVIDLLKGLGYIRINSIFYVYSFDAVLRRLHFRDVLAGIRQEREDKNATIISGGRAKPVLRRKGRLRYRRKD